ncbi:MAG: transposase [Blastochloris sp.]|nr:transposase [Blastochloris sp.]
MSQHQWDVLRTYLPNRTGRVGWPMQLEMRKVLNAIFYVLRTGCHWYHYPTALERRTARTPASPRTLPTAQPD